MTGPGAAEVAGKHCLIGDGALEKWYRSLVDRGLMSPDAHQAGAVVRLQALANAMPRKNGRPLASKLSSLLARVKSKKKSDKPPRGVYLHGSVGRGKSFLMDGFYLNLPIPGKLRVHFHSFMRHFHADMKVHEDSADPLLEVAKKLAAKYALICFDEFHVSDIADAMLLGRILQILLDSGAVLVATSNYAPDSLYPNGLARDRFLPAIALLKERLDEFNLDGDTDYRRRALHNAGIYLHPDNDRKRGEFGAIYDSLAMGMSLMPSFKSGTRRIPAVRRSSDIIWFEFEELCGGNWSQVDYLRLAERFATVLLSGVPVLGTEKKPEELRRFTWLVDVLYDARINLVLLAETPLGGMFIAEGGESGRTLSRLEEMQSSEYCGDTR